jgi:hypothetical protein
VVILLRFCALGSGVRIFESTALVMRPGAVGCRVMSTKNNIVQSGDRLSRAV